MADQRLLTPYFQVDQECVVPIIVKELSFSLAGCHGIQAFRDKGKQCIIV